MRFHTRQYISVCQTRGPTCAPYPPKIRRPPKVLYILVACDVHAMASKTVTRVLASSVATHERALWSYVVWCMLYYTLRAATLTPIHPDTITTTNYFHRASVAACCSWRVVRIAAAVVRRRCCLRIERTSSLPARYKTEGKSATCVILPWSWERTVCAVCSTFHRCRRRACLFVCLCVCERNETERQCAEHERCLCAKKTHAFWTRESRVFSFVCEIRVKLAVHYCVLISAWFAWSVYNKTSRVVCHRKLHYYWCVLWAACRRLQLWESRVLNACGYRIYHNKMRHSITIIGVVVVTVLAATFGAISGEDQHDTQHLSSSSSANGTYCVVVVINRVFQICVYDPHFKRRVNIRDCKHTHTKTSCVFDFHHCVLLCLMARYDVFIIFTISLNRIHLWACLWRIASTCSCAHESIPLQKAYTSIRSVCVLFFSFRCVRLFVWCLRWPTPLCVMITAQMCTIWIRNSVIVVCACVRSGLGS